jgi:RXT2-like, N-terminal
VLTLNGADLLAPLTRPGDLPDHPTLSRPFTSKPLTDLTRQAREMVQKEKSALWRMKHLLTLMSGDHIWIPCEMLETENDINLFNDGSNGYREHLMEKTRLKESHRLAPSDGTLEEKTIAAASSALEDGPEMQAPADVVENATPEVTAAEDDVAMIDASNETPVDKVVATTSTAPNKAAMDPESNQTVDVILTTNPEDGDAEGALKLTEEPTGDENKSAEAVPQIKIDDGSEGPHPEAEAEDPAKPLDEVQVQEPDDEEATQDQEDAPEPRRMRTRAQAQAASDNNTTISRPRSTTPSTNTSFIHPYFLAPPSAHPVPDMGLPPVEAEETRRLLQLYIQKQEEICRGSQKIYDGLMRAERLRKTVLKWAKADGHLGEMSDGEDWYDKEEWGLSEDLKKGQDEEEEDAATTAKKTRTRRQ